MSTSARPTVVGSSIVVVDDGATSDDPVTAQTIDPATGKTVVAVDPKCPDDGEISGETELETDTRVQLIPGTDDVVAAFGMSYGCIARWEVSTGTVRWRTTVPPGTSFLEGDGLVTATDFVFGDANNGTSRVDLATGERLWSTSLPSGTELIEQDDEYGTSESVSEGADRMLLVGTGKGVRLVTFDADRQVRSQEIDLVTGELGDATTRKIPSRYSSSGSLSLTVESVSPDRLVITADNLLAVVPTGTSGEVLRFPR